MVLYGNNGITYTILDRYAQSGEADLYFVDGYSDLVAKIYRDNKQVHERSEKIKAIAEIIKDYSVSACLVVPITLLYNTSKQDTDAFCGYIVNRFDNYVTLSKVLNDESIDYYQKATIARNLCNTIAQIHNSNMIVGDLTPSKILIDPVTLNVVIDEIDEFQLSAELNGKELAFTCNCADPMYLAPEIQKKLAEESISIYSAAQNHIQLFNKNTDNYSLACHIFALLMGGCSPFIATVDFDELASQHKDADDIEIDYLRAALNGEFLFSKSIQFKKLPYYAPNYNVLSLKLQSLFENSFANDTANSIARPDENDFSDAIDEYIKSLSKLDCGHYMLKDCCRGCEWCRIKSETDSRKVEVIDDDSIWQ